MQVAETNSLHFIHFRYTLSMTLTGTQTFRIQHVGLLSAVQSYFTTAIPERLGVTRIDVDEFHALSNISCDKVTGTGPHELAIRVTDNGTNHMLENMPVEVTNHWTGDVIDRITNDAKDHVNAGVQLLVHMTFFIDEFVHRSDTERTLNDLVNDKHFIDVRNDNGTTIGVTSLQSEPSIEAYMTPVLIDQSHFTDRCFIKNTSQSSMPHQDYSSVHASKLMLCEQIELTKQEFVLQQLQMEVRVTVIDKVLGFDRFHHVSRDMIRVCLADVSELTLYDMIAEAIVRSDVDIALGIVTFVCTLGSLLCLILTFFVYCLCPQMRTVPGCINMFLMTSLFIAQCTFQFGYLFYSVHAYCVVVGLLTHLSWLVMFCWMNVSSFHMMRVFSGIDVANQNSTKNNRKVLIGYSLYAFGVPALVVLSTVMTLGLQSDWLSLGYGETSICFINHEIIFYVTFMAPVVLICVGNLVFFSFTAFKIRQTPTTARSSGNKRHFDIYVRLFFLTGITWLLVVLETLLPVTALSFLTTILNGCQGVYIFISYVLNRRSLGMVKTQFATISMRLSSTSDSRTSRKSTTTVRNRNQTESQT